MPLYEFKSKSGEVVEKFFKMGKCPKFITRKKQRYNRIFSLPNMIIDSQTPKTLGALAEANTLKREKMGLNKNKKKKKVPNPFWRPHRNKPNMELTKKTKAQLQRYMMTGE